MPPRFEANAGHRAALPLITLIAYPDRSATNLNPQVRVWMIRTSIRRDRGTPSHKQVRYQLLIEDGAARLVLFRRLSPPPWPSIEPGAPSEFRVQQRHAAGDLQGCSGNGPFRRARGGGAEGLDFRLCRSLPIVMVWPPSRFTRQGPPCWLSSPTDPPRSGSPAHACSRKDWVERPGGGTAVRDSCRSVVAGRTAAAPGGARLGRLAGRSGRWFWRSRTGEDRPARLREFEARPELERIGGSGVALLTTTPAL